MFDSKRSREGASGEVFSPVLSGWKRGLFGLVEQSKGQGPVKYFKAASSFACNASGEST